MWYGCAGCMRTRRTYVVILSVASLAGTTHGMWLPIRGSFIFGSTPAPYERRK